MYFIGSDLPLPDTALYEAIWAFTDQCPSFKSQCDFEFPAAFMSLLTLLHCGLVLSDQTNSELLMAAETQQNDSSVPIESTPGRKTNRKHRLPHRRAASDLINISPIFDPIAGVVEINTSCSDCGKKRVEEEVIISLDFTVLFNDQLPKIRESFKKWRFEEGLRTKKVKSSRWKLMSLIADDKFVDVSTIYDYMSHFNTTPENIIE